MEPNLVLTLESGDELSVRHFAVHEAMSRMFEVDIVARSEDRSVDFEAIIGKAASLRIKPGLAAAPERVRQWKGICRLIEQVQAEGTGLSTYHLIIVPALWRLTLRRNNRIFQHMTLPDIAEKLLGEWEIKPRTDYLDEYLKHEYVVQYGESDYAFLCRTLERAGIAFYFDFRDGKTELVLTDHTHDNPLRAGDPIPFVAEPTELSGHDLVTRVQLFREVRPGQLTYRDFDFRRKPDEELIATAKADERRERFYEQYVYEPGAFREETGKGERLTFADDRGIARHDEKVGERRAERSLRGVRQRERTVSFSTNCLDLSPGTVFQIDDHPRPELSSNSCFIRALLFRGGRGELLVSEFSVSGTHDGKWSYSGSAVFNRFDGDVVQYRPVPVTPRPRIFGVQSAMVVGPSGEEIHVDELGRVRVQFHWDREGQRDERSSCWVRVSQTWAGPANGVTLLPRVGHEVLVGFLEGDPELPVVVGRVFSASAPTPYLLPEHRTKSTWKSRSSPGSDGFNEIMFEDARGQELVYMQAQRDLQKLVKEVETERTGQDRMAVVGRDRTELVGEVAETYVGGRHVIEMVAPPSAEDLKILRQEAPAVAPLPTKVEMVDRRVIFTTGRASLVFDGTNILMEAEGDITVRAKGDDLEINGRPVYINTKDPKPLPAPDEGGWLDWLTGPAAKFWDGLLAAASMVQEGVEVVSNWGVAIAASSLVSYGMPFVRVWRWLSPYDPAYDAEHGEQAAYDGDFVGPGCEPVKGTNPGEGVRPAKCRDSDKPLPKVYFVNGIQNKILEGGSFEGSQVCQTMHQLADTTCSEVIGVYNATISLLADVNECISGIERAGKTPAAKTLADAMLAHLTSGSQEPMTIYAHSQGGLITQEALLETKAQLIAQGMTRAQAEEAMSRLHIKSFGTAVFGWPRGPEYESFTNSADPVPYVITEAQKHYPVETFRDSAMPDKMHVFTDGHLNPLTSHGMGETYLPYLDRQLEKEAGPRDQRCTC